MRRFPWPISCLCSVRAAGTLLLALALLAAFGLISTRLFTTARAQSGVACSPAYHIDEALPSGARWELCWEPRAQEGIVLRDIAFTPPAGPRRLVLASASLAQVHVPYDDNGARFHDITDFGFGGVYLANLLPEECPAGQLLQHAGKNALCKQIHARGLAQRYYGRTLNGYELSLFSISTSGDYNYIVQWVFKDDGTIEPVVGAAGQLQRYGSDPQYGWRTGPGPLPISHFHNYWWRLDFDIDGLANDLVEEIEFATSDAGRRRVLQVTPLTTESARVHNQAAQRTWRVRDTAVNNADGNAISYQIEALSSGHDFVGPDFEPFSKNDLYVTRARDCERFPSHNPMLNGCGDDVTDFVNGEDVDGQDVVVWYGITFHHLPRSEDEIWMNVHWDGFTIVPRDWTSSNPLDARTNSDVGGATATPTFTPPPPATSTPTATPSPTPTIPSTGCTNFLLNGGFELSAGWAVGSTSFPASYTTDPPYSGTRAMRAGLPASALNQLSYSSFFQRVTIPADAAQTYVQYWERPGGAGDGVDTREALVLDSNFGLLRTLERSTAAGTDTWRQRRFDVSALKGKSTILYFNVYNNGGGGRLWNTYDDVELLVCGSSQTQPESQPLGITPAQMVFDAAQLPSTVDLSITAQGQNLEWNAIVDRPWLTATTVTTGTPGLLRLAIAPPPGTEPVSAGNVLVSAVDDKALAGGAQVVVLRDMNVRQFLPAVEVPPD